MTDFYHVCFAVPDLEAAMDDLDAAAGIEWSAPRADTLGDWPYRIVFSRTALHIELIEGPPGSPWDTAGGAHFHHLGWWTHSLSGSARQLAEAGLPPDFDGCPYGRSFAYHRMDSIGARIEIVDIAAQPAFLQTWNPSGDPMPALGDPRRTPPIRPATGVDAGLAAVCHAVLVEFLAAIDHGHATTALDLFTEDASFTARGQQLHGRDAISGFLTEREAETDRQTVHMIANETVRVDNTGEEITLDAVLVLLVRDGAGQYVIERVLDTTQQFVPTPAGWRITSRDTTPFHPPTA